MLFVLLKVCLFLSGVILFLITLPTKYEDVEELKVKIVVMLISLLLIGLSL